LTRTGRWSRSPRPSAPCGSSWFQTVGPRQAGSIPAMERGRGGQGSQTRLEFLTTWDTMGSSTKCCRSLAGSTSLSALLVRPVFYLRSSGRCSPRQGTPPLRRRCWDPTDPFWRVGNPCLQCAGDIALQEPAVF
jgi:hypothetical protein